MTKFTIPFTSSEWDMIRYACMELSSKRREQHLDNIKNQEYSLSCLAEAEHLGRIADKISHENAKLVERRKE